MALPQEPPKKKVRQSTGLPTPEADPPNGRKRSTSSMPVPAPQRTRRAPAPEPPAAGRSQGSRAPIPEEDSSFSDVEDSAIEDSASFEMIGVDEQDDFDEMEEQEEYSPITSYDEDSNSNFEEDEQDVGMDFDNEEPVREKRKPVSPKRQPRTPRESPSSKQREERPQSGSSQKRKSVSPNRDKIQEKKAGVSERKRKSLAKNTSKPTKRKASGKSNEGTPLGAYDPNYKETPVFIDEENLELEPYGGKKRKNSWVSDIDTRPNRNKKAALVKYCILGLFASTTAFGFANAIFPPPSLSEAEVSAIVAEQTGDYGFPTERGQGFATDFISVWAERNDSPLRQSALNHFYGGDISTMESIETGGDFRQDIIYGPTVYDVTSRTAYSETYTIGVGVSVSDTLSGVPQEIDGEPNIQWRYFAVDVFWDEQTQSLGIPAGSPSLVPPQGIISTEEIPVHQIPGATRNEELDEPTTNVIRQFFAGYAQSSNEDFSSVDPFINTEARPDNIGILTQGLNGELELNGEPADAVQHEVYQLDPDDTTSAIAVVNVQWSDPTVGSIETDEDSPSTGESSVSYNSQYLLFVDQTAEGSWIITGMQQMPYGPELEEQE